MCHDTLVTVTRLCGAARSRLCHLVLALGGARPGLGLIFADSSKVARRERSRDTAAEVRVSGVQAHAMVK